MDKILLANDPLIATPSYVKDNDFWILPFEGGLSRVAGHEYIVDAFPSKYPVIGVQIAENQSDNVRDYFTWTDGEHKFATWYWGDSVYYTVVQLDDGLWARYDIYTYAKKHECLGDMLANSVVRAIEIENEYEHVISFDCYGNESITRGRRLAEKVPTSKLLTEKAELEHQIERCKAKREEATNKRIWTHAIERHMADLKEVEDLLSQKL